MGLQGSMLSEKMKVSGTTSGEAGEKHVRFDTFCLIMRIAQCVFAFVSFVCAGSIPIINHSKFTITQMLSLLKYGEEPYSLVGVLTSPLGFLLFRIFVVCWLLF